VAVSLAKRLTKCMTSEHYQVAERALLMWNNDKLKTLLKTDPYKSIIVPIIIEGLMSNAHQHWNPYGLFITGYRTVQGITFFVMKIIVTDDAQLFDKCT
jgi:serine/threonine-protein phosphatase 2A regulatory subunit B'